MLETEEEVIEPVVEPQPAPLSTAPEGLVVACVDIGSVPGGGFGWWSSAGASGNLPSSLVDHVHGALAAGRPVALGFECPLFVPLPDDEQKLTCARPGEGSRPWSVFAGSQSLATGLTEVAWCLARLRERCLADPASAEVTAFTSWTAFNLIHTVKPMPALFLWEAFVTGKAKAKRDGDAPKHIEDAEIGARSFMAALPDVDAANAIHCEGQVHSLLGAALLRTGWTEDVLALSLPCVVIKAKAPPAP